jgi:hypothetical protein
MAGARAETRPMSRITISYRRDDSGVITGRIFDRLAAHYGREAVFRDIDNIPPGVDFRKHISDILDASDIVLAIVGPRWVGPRAGQSRLANAADPVRVEIETALRKDRPLIPVLVLRASMPRVEQLPESLQDFAYRNAVSIDAGQDFDVHIARLIRAMDRILGREAKPALENELEKIRDDNDGLPPAEGDTERHVSGETTQQEAASELLAQVASLKEQNQVLEAHLSALTASQKERAKAATEPEGELTAALAQSEQGETQLAGAMTTPQAAERRIIKPQSGTIRDDLVKTEDKLKLQATSEQGKSSPIAASTIPPDRQILATIFQIIAAFAIGAFLIGLIVWLLSVLSHYP